MKKEYNLHLVFATKGSGEYLADVNVTIKKMSGAKVLETGIARPAFYANLPPGNYRISAEFAGKSQSRSVTLNKRGSRISTY